jgi:hypothetical protein
MVRKNRAGLERAAKVREEHERRKLEKRATKRAQILAVNAAGAAAAMRQAESAPVTTASSVQNGVSPDDVFSKENIDRVARQVSSGPKGLAFHQPEPWAGVNVCIDNVLRKVERDGGRALYGWTLSMRRAAAGDYLLFTHHAVWNSPVGTLIDVTPLHPNPAIRPILQGSSTLILVDFDAEPVLIRAANGKHAYAPLPSKYLPLKEGEELQRYLAGRQQDEDRTCREMYERIEAGTYVHDPIEPASPD